MLGEGPGEDVPAVPSATKKNSSVTGGLSTAAIDSRPGLAIGVGGKPLI
jgi:hypothetical protein